MANKMSKCHLTRTLNLIKKVNLAWSKWWNEETTVSDSCEYDVNANPDADNAWSTVLNNWLEDLAAEYDEGFVSESLDMSERLNHPADDPIAKWSLADLFVIELPAPSAINNLQLVYNME